MMMLIGRLLFAFVTGVFMGCIALGFVDHDMGRVVFGTLLTPLSFELTRMFAKYQEIEEAKDDAAREQSETARTPAPPDPLVNYIYAPDIAAAAVEFINADTNLARLPSRYKFSEYMAAATAREDRLNRLRELVKTSQQ